MSRINLLSVLVLFAQISASVSAINPQDVAREVLNDMNFMPAMGMAAFVHNDKIEFDVADLEDKILDYSKRAKKAKISTELVTQNPKRFLVEVALMGGFEADWISFAFSTANELVKLESDRFSKSLNLGKAGSKSERSWEAEFQPLTSDGPVNRVLSRLSDLRLNYIVEYKVSPIVGGTRQTGTTSFETRAYVMSSREEFLEYALADTKARLTTGLVQVKANVIAQTKKAREAIDTLNAAADQIREDGSTDFSSLAELTKQPETQLKKIRAEASGINELQEFRDRIEQGLQD